MAAARREAEAEAAGARAEAHASAEEAKRNAAERHQLSAQLRPLLDATAALGGLRARAEAAEGLSARAEAAEAEAAALRPLPPELRAERDEARRKLAEAAVEVRAAEGRAERAASARQRAEAEAAVALKRADERQAAAEAAAERLRVAADEGTALLHEQLDAVRAEKRGAEQRETWAHDRASVLEQQRRVLLCLSDRGRLAQSSPLDRMGLDRMGLLAGMDTPLAAPSTPATGRGGL